MQFGEFINRFISLQQTIIAIYVGVEPHLERRMPPKQTNLHAEDHAVLKHIRHLRRGRDLIERRLDLDARHLLNPLQYFDRLVHVESSLVLPKQWKDFEWRMRGRKGWEVACWLANSPCVPVLDSIHSWVHDLPFL